ncbi:MAG: acyl-CoA desaturase [Saprospiraceae bacterium]|nr:acyl-CoA desaturase [Saprospiraceae bacterium]
MKTIKFIGNDDHQKAFASAVRKNVHDYFTDNGLSTKGNLRLAIQTVVMLLLYIIPFVFILTIPMNGWVGMLMAIIMGTGVAGIGMCVMHDAAHDSYSHKKWVNQLFGSTLYLLGSNVLNWKIQHNLLHHTYTNIEGYDQDIESKGPLRLSENAPLKKIHYYQHIHAFFFYGLMTISRLFREFSQLLEFNKAGIIKHLRLNGTYEYTKMVVIKILYVLVIIGLPILYTPFAWWEVLIGFMIMHFVGGCILGTIFQMAHVVEGSEQMLANEDGVIDCEWAVHELRTSANFAPNNKFLEYYAGGLNFQIEHHLFPNISHIHYRKIAPIVERTAKEFGYPYNLKPNFRAALQSHVVRLKELGQTDIRIAEATSAF